MSDTIDLEKVFREDGRRLVLSAFGRLERWHDAEDAVQEAFLKAWQERDDYEPRADKPPVAWVAAITKWESLAIMGSRRRYVPAGEWADRFAEREDRDTSTGLPCMADADVCVAVHAALASLSDQQRLAAQMYCLQGMPYSEVARCMRVEAHEAAVFVASVLNRKDWSRAASKVELRPRARPPSTFDSVQPDKAEVDGYRSHPEVLAALTKRGREVIRLRYLEGCSIAEVADRMGIEPHGVTTYVAAARKLLRAALDGVKIEPHRKQRGSAPADVTIQLLDDPEGMAALSPRQREAVILRYRDNLSLVQVARRMGTTPTAVTAIVKRVTRHERARQLAKAAAARHPVLQAVGA